MKSFKQFLSEGAEVTLDDVIAAVKGYKRIPSKPIFRGIKRTPDAIVEKIPRTAKIDGEGRRARDSAPIVHNAFNAMMELVYGVDPLFRSNTFNVTGTYDTAKIYGDVFFIFFANDCVAYRTEEVSDSGFVDVRKFLSKHFDTSDMHKKILDSMKKLNTFNDEEFAQYRRKQEALLSHKIHHIISNSPTLKDMHEAFEKEGYDTKLLDAALRDLSETDFKLSKNAVKNIGKFSGSGHEMFIYGCDKYLGVSVTRLAGLMGYSEGAAHFNSEEEHAKLYKEFLSKLN